MQITVIRIQRPAGRPITIALPLEFIRRHNLRFLMRMGGKSSKNPATRGKFKREDITTVQMALREEASEARGQLRGLADAMTSALAHPGSTGYYTAHTATIRTKGSSVIVLSPIDGPMINAQLLSMSEKDAEDFMGVLRYSHNMQYGSGMFISADKPPVIKKEFQCENSLDGWISDKMSDSTQKAMSRLYEMVHNEGRSLHLTLVHI